MSNKLPEQTIPQEDELIRKLFIEEYQSMCRTAYYTLGDYGLAETAVQETFLVALRFRNKLWNYAPHRNPKLRKICPFNYASQTPQSRKTRWAT